MNNNKLISFLYLVTSEASFVEMAEKNKIMFTILTYDLKVVLTGLSDDKVELNFIVKTIDNFNEDPSKGDKKIIDLELVKPFIIDSYVQYNLETNNKIIKQVGEAQYQQWLERDLQLLKNPYEVPGIDNLQIEDMLKSSHEGKMIMFQNTNTKLNEAITVIPNNKTLEKIGFLEVQCSHFAVDNTEVNKPKYTTCYIRYKIPMLELENYPFLYNFYRLKPQEDIFSTIVQKNRNKELGNIV